MCGLLWVNSVSWATKQVLFRNLVAFGVPKKYSPLRPFPTDSFGAKRIRVDLNNCIVPIV